MFYALFYNIYMYATDSVKNVELFYALFYNICMYATNSVT